MSRNRYDEVIPRQEVEATDAPQDAAGGQGASAQASNGGGAEPAAGEVDSAQGAEPGVELGGPCGLKPNDDEASTAPADVAPDLLTTSPPDRPAGAARTAGGQTVAQPDRAAPPVTGAPSRTPLGPTDPPAVLQGAVGWKLKFLLAVVMILFVANPLESEPASPQHGGGPKYLPRDQVSPPPASDKHLPSRTPLKGEGGQPAPGPTQGGAPPPPQKGGAKQAAEKAEARGFKLVTGMSAYILFVAVLLRCLGRRVRLSAGLILMGAGGGVFVGGSLTLWPDIAAGGALIFLLGHLKHVGDALAHIGHTPPA